ncbi:MAG: EAL domain-containing protein [Lachnospiraceae bacterium]|nr:EAL domain-containing protein [Lachnospiraceae bacterium]
MDHKGMEIDNNSANSREESSVLFEYNIQKDTMNYSRNINKFIPCAMRIDSFSDGMEVSGKIYPEDVRRALNFFRPIMVENPDEERSETFRCMDFDGNFRWFKATGKAINDENKKPLMIYGNLAPVNAEVTEGEAVSKIDEATGLDNYRSAERKIKNIYAEDMDSTLSTLLLISVSVLDEIRREKGGDSADRLMGKAAKLLKDAIRNSDVLGRYSDNSFIFAMRGITDVGIVCSKASYMLTSLRDLLREEYPDHASGVNIGISLSQPVFPVGYDVMLERAEKALKRAREDGDTFYVYDGVLRSREEFELAPASAQGDMTLIKNILDPIVTWAYAVDADHNIIYMNKAMKERFDGVKEGLCYNKLKGKDSPCLDCPMKLMADNERSQDFDVYSPDLRAMEHVRCTRISLKNHDTIFVIADVNEDIKQQMREIEKSMHHFNDAIAKSHDIIWEINLSRNKCTRVRETNIAGLSGDRVVSYAKLRREVLDNLVHYQDREEFLAATDPDAIHEAVKMGKTTINKQLRIKAEDGSYRWYDVSSVLYITDDYEEDELVIFSARDINELKTELRQKAMVEAKYHTVVEHNEYMQELAQSNERYEHVNELTGIFVFEYDVTNKSYYVCTTFEEMFELSEWMLSDEWSLLEGLVVHNEDREKFTEFIKRVKSQPDTHEITVRLINRYEVSRWFTITVQTLNGLNNELYRVLVILQDVNAEMEIKAELEFRADYDSMTKLYNSEAFYRKAQEIIHSDSEMLYAIISVDIDRFRVINDRFGIKTGNRCLEELGRCIRESLKGENIAGRYMADVFSILVAYERERQIFDYIDELTASFSFDAARRCGSTLSFGIYMINKRDLPVRLMCDRARMAKQEIKNNSITNFAVYDDKVRIQQRKISEITSQMNVALDNNEFVMYLQPKVDLKTEKLCGAEALVRWLHPTKGIHSPGEFIPLFESNGFVKKLDEYMWETACEYLARLKSMGEIIPISVNISRFHVNNTDLVRVLTDMINRNGIDPKYLELEITETLFTDNAEDLYATMQRLKDIGFVIEMDDFGSGYSSLNMLRRAPVDIIKIDRYFIDKIMSTKRGRIIVENSVSMSRQLGLKVVAEGVETREQADFLKSINCDVAQGYFYSKPVTTEEFEKLLKTMR